METKPILRLIKVAEQSDLALISLVISRNDHQAFAGLVKKYQSSIRHFLRRLTAGDHHQAEDLSQETFIIAFEKLYQYKSSGSFKSWLHTIAYRLFIKNLSKTIHIEYDHHKHDPQTSMAAAQADIYAEQLMQVLKPKERVVMTLSCSTGMSHQEIHNITHLPLGSIKSLIKRGKDKIMQIVEEEQKFKVVS